MNIKITELGYGFGPDIPVFPGDNPMQVTPVSTYEKQGWQSTYLACNSHTSTHIDAPAHVIPGGRTIDTYPAEAFMGPARVAHLKDAGRVSLDGTQFLLFYSGWSNNWGKPGYYTDFPVLTASDARHLATLAPHGLKGVGFDTPSPEAVRVGFGLPVHHILLGAGLFVIENLHSLETLKDKDFLFSAVPLQITHGDGCPVRALAMEF